MDVYHMPVLSLISLVLFPQIVLAQGGDWDKWWTYSGFSGPTSWGGFNPAWKLCSSGKHQSPINIIPADLLYDANLKHIVVEKHHVKGKLVNEGHNLAVVLSKESQKVMVKDGPLSYQYIIDEIVIHYGGTDKQGSEHTIDSKAFPIEIQMMAYNSDLYSTMSEALTNYAGVAAISIFVALNSTSSQELQSLLTHVPQVQFKGDFYELPKFSVHNLLPDTSNYLTYDGSLTKPGCQESVTWIIMNKPLYISQSQLEKLRQTARSDKSSDSILLMENNYRPVQSLNRRTIRTNIDFSKDQSAKTPPCEMKREKSYKVNTRSAVKT